MKAFIPKFLGGIFVSLGVVGYGKHFAWIAHKNDMHIKIVWCDFCDKRENLLTGTADSL